MVGVSKYLNKMLLFLVDVKFVPWTYGRGGGGGSGFFFEILSAQKWPKTSKNQKFLPVFRYLRKDDPSQFLVL